MVDDKSTSFDFFLHKLEKINAQFIKDEETRLGGPYTGSGIRRKVRVKVLGVWDTVGALGLPDYAVVENVGLGDNNSFYDTRLHYG